VHVAPNVSTVVAVNGRFLGAPVTGAQRYARELVSRVGLTAGLGVLLVGPGRRPDRAVSDVPAGPWWSGVRGHAWEQFVLPRRAAALRADVLLSLCNSGPLWGPPQVIGLLDTSPYVRPGDFDASFVRWSRFAWPRLASHARSVVTLSQRTAAELVDVVGVPADRIAIVPPGVGPPFTDHVAVHGSRQQTCLFVGGHDPRKNLGFLLDLWPDVHARLGLDLLVVRRGTSRPHGATRVGVPAGVRVIEDPDDHALVELYATTLCVLSPSHYEGFGLPLLEGMAVGTPFLSTDTGAARELAVDPGQVLPLKADAWMSGLAWMAGGAADALGAQGRERARAHTWERSAEAVAGLLGGASP
jgi:glycosyltransferase involved in cell wall biosynthesis